MSRKTTRKAQKTQRLGVDAEEGHDINTAVAGPSTTAHKRGKAPITKSVKRAKYSEEAESYDDSESYTASDTEDSTPCIREDMFLPCRIGRRTNAHT